MASAGIFYSLMVLSLLAPIVLYIVSYMGAVQTQGQQMTVKFEGIELANFADSIALDVPRVLDIASKRAMVAVIGYADDNGYAVNDSENELRNLIIYQNFTNGAYAPIMMNISFSSWINATELIGADHGFYANLSVGNLRINQSSPFELNFTIELRANITDSTGDMKLYRVYNATEIVPIDGFTDPLYPLNTRLQVQRTIVRVNFTVNDSASVINMLKGPYGPYYTNNTDAPAFLERLQGCTWPKDNVHNCSGKYPGMGIESFVDYVELRGWLQDFELKPNSSMVDHEYFNATLSPGCNVTGVTTVSGYDWFKISNNSYAHNTTYGVGIYGCP